LSPIYEQIKYLSQSAMDGLQDWTIRIDQTVDWAIVIHDWAQKDLNMIQRRSSSSFGARVDNALRAVGLPMKLDTGEAEVVQTFFRLTEGISKGVTKALKEAQENRAILILLKDQLELLAQGLLEKKESFRSEKLREKNYWKSLFRHYRETMHDFDRRMEMCSEFYFYTEVAISQTRKVDLKAQDIRSQLKIFQEFIEEDQLMLSGPDPLPLQPYLDMLQVSVSNLGKSKEAAKLWEKEMMQKLDDAIDGKSPMGEKGKVLQLGEAPYVDGRRVGAPTW
jgi:hypothetical protein